MTKIAFLFPGQGSQTVGMGGHVFDAYPTAKRTLEEADEALGAKLSDMIRQGPEEALRETANAQPAILTVSVAIARILMEKGVQPTVMAGHSLGEYSALVMADAISFQDAVRLVRSRGRYMQDAVPLGAGTMSAVLGADNAVVEDACREVSATGRVVEPANYNCPGQLVISGSVEGVAAATELLKSRGVKKLIPLKVSAPFHCSLLRPAAEMLAKDLSTVDVRDPKIPYVANVDAEVVATRERIKQRLVDQVAKPVLWTQSLQRILSEFAPSKVVEVGPGQVVCGHMKKIDDTVPRFPTDSVEALAAFGQ